MDALYCTHGRCADSCEDCAAQSAGLKNAQDGPAAVLPGAPDSKTTGKRKNSTQARA